MDVWVWNWGDFALVLLHWKSNNQTKEKKLNCSSLHFTRKFAFLLRNRREEQNSRLISQSDDLKCFYILNGFRECCCGFKIFECLILYVFVCCPYRFHTELLSIYMDIYLFFPCIFLHLWCTSKLKLLALYVYLNIPPVSLTRCAPTRHLIFRVVVCGRKDLCGPYVGVLTRIQTPKEHIWVLGLCHSTWRNLRWVRLPPVSTVTLLTKFSVLDTRPSILSSLGISATDILHCSELHTDVGNVYILWKHFNVFASVCLIILQ